MEEITSYTCKYGLFQFSLMPFGLLNATSMLQRMATELLGDLDFVKVYIVEVVIYSNFMTEHTTHITVVCEQIR